jgi:hypothetical protein
MLSGEAAAYAQLIASAAPGTLPHVQSDLGGFEPVARLATALPADAAAIRSVVGGLSSRTLMGDDALVLTAFAVRRAGGEEWSRFRERAADLARTAGASGAALQVVNHLEGYRAR